MRNNSILYLIIFSLLTSAVVGATQSYSSIKKVNVSTGNVNIIYQIVNIENKLLSYEEMASLGVSLTENKALESCFLKIMQDIVTSVESYKMQYVGFKFFIKKVSSQKLFQLKISGRNNKQSKATPVNWITGSYAAAQPKNGNLPLQDVFEAINKDSSSTQIKAFCFASENGTVLISTKKKVVSCYNLFKEGNDKEIIAWLQGFLTMIYLFYEYLPNSHTPFSRAGKGVAQTVAHIHGRIKTNLATKIKQLRNQEKPLVFAKLLYENNKIKILLNEKAIQALGVDVRKINTIKSNKSDKIQPNQQEESSTTNEEPETRTDENLPDKTRDMPQKTGQKIDICILIVVIFINFFLLYKKIKKFTSRTNKLWVAK